LIFDYNRGYADDIEASGIMDVFRIPKFAYYFYKSQRPPQEPVDHSTEPGAFVYIANYWTAHSGLDVKVYSNCQQVSLLLNGKEIAIPNPDRDVYSTNLAHAPFTFKLDKFQSGELEAIGLIGGVRVASYKVRTPSAPRGLLLNADVGGIEPRAGMKDALFVHAAVVDEYGTVIPEATNAVEFILRGPARLLGQNPIAAEAGIASILVETRGQAGVVEIEAKSAGLSAVTKIQIKE
jgi:beta-galactosidase